jgi:hypothetical protein
LTWSNFGMGDLPGSFPVSVRVMTKHAGKTRVDLWGQSAILKAVWMLQSWSWKLQSLECLIQWG